MEECGGEELAPPSLESLFEEVTLENISIFLPSDLKRTGEDAL